MPRTTVNIDAPVLRQLKALQTRKKIPLGQLMSQLLSEALGRQASSPAAAPEFLWYSQPMHALVDLEDKEHIQRILDGLE